MIAIIGFGSSILVFFFELYISKKALTFQLHRQTRLVLLTAPLQLMAIVRFFSREERAQIRKVSEACKRRIVNIDRTSTEDNEDVNEGVDASTSFHKIVLSRSAQAKTFDNERSINFAGPMEYQWRRRKHIQNST